MLFALSWKNENSNRKKREDMRHRLGGPLRLANSTQRGDHFARSRSLAARMVAHACNRVSLTAAACLWCPRSACTLSHRCSLIAQEFPVNEVRSQICSAPDLTGEQLVKRQQYPRDTAIENAPRDTPRMQ
ncbi:hypothetical protein HBI56_222640 [Parastagonospora nodorum]|uniref:Uncharacterized protein n=1 Tax=Phaeosphaeria nodorum (strain SN15 / ATCC MYA-4574 / FGSC 10173) TaxID=321614 RepID=A0A7U2EWP2_PHANO|nr:hypothetical protein HBH56_148330 [Parastagonospora nodorum]QRC94102.1 hypothetical protein JI435_430220 [Parastagonospora nodorum SN15]KAH3923325.1 hypothetical protein HBH54_212970 [Parastagonospora nodorum]KAH3946035.1 hypothetical protein HBH53_135790 [Parastagonospora nodorum]KAH3983751.1 hypothetical protein HBH52_064230 [Parastagonospora nodorum]